MQDDSDDSSDSPDEVGLPLTVGREEAANKRAQVRKKKSKTSASTSASGTKSTTHANALNVAPTATKSAATLGTTPVQPKTTRRVASLDRSKIGPGTHAESEDDMRKQRQRRKEKAAQLSSANTNVVTSASASANANAAALSKRREMEAATAAALQHYSHILQDRSPSPSPSSSSSPPPPPHHHHPIIPAYYRQQASTLKLANPSATVAMIVNEEEERARLHAFERVAPSSSGSLIPPPPPSQSHAGANHLPLTELFDWSDIGLGAASGGASAGGSGNGLSATSMSSGSALTRRPNVGAAPRPKSAYPLATTTSTATPHGNLIIDTTASAAAAASSSSTSARRPSGTVPVATAWHASMARTDDALENARPSPRPMSSAGGQHRRAQSSSSTMGSSEALAQVLAQTMSTNGAGSSHPSAGTSSVRRLDVPSPVHPLDRFLGLSSHGGSSAPRPYHHLPSNPSSHTYSAPRSSSSFVPPNGSHSSGVSVGQSLQALLSSASSHFQPTFRNSHTSATAAMRAKLAMTHRHINERGQSPATHGPPQSNHVPPSIASSPPNLSPSHSPSHSPSPSSSPILSSLLQSHAQPLQIHARSINSTVPIHQPRLNHPTSSISTAALRAQSKSRPRSAQHY